MRIAIVGNFGLGYKGTMAARAAPIARELARRGHEVELFLPEDGTAAPSALDLDGVSIRLLGPHPTGRVSSGRDAAAPGIFSTGRAAAVVSLAVQLPWSALRSHPDVVYTFKPIGYAGLSLLAGWTMGKLGWRRLLVVDADDWEGSGGWAERDRASALRTAVVDWQEHWGLGHADVVTVASRELERLVRSTFNQTVVYAPNAASPDSPGWRLGNPASLRRALGLPTQPVVLAYTRFVEFSPTRLAEVAARILARVPDAHLALAGQGLAGEERDFVRRLGERGLADRVHALGWVKSADLPDVFAAANLALYPLDDTRLNRAKCPMKLVDLLLAGVPVVADAVGQANEYIQDASTGVLVPAGDVEAMVHRAIDLLNDPERRRCLGAQARHRVLSTWTWSSQADIIDGAIRQAAKRLAISRDSSP
jgi:glycosyltransferase involved in cell wall biosynthesis